MLSALLVASTVTIGAHIGSVHIPADAQFNNVNPGLYVRVDSFTAGIYHNSYKETTVYAGRIVDLTDKLDLTVGVAYGYQKHSVGGKSYGFSKGAFVPAAVFSYETPKVMGLQPRIFMIPALNKDTSSVLSLGVEF